MSGYTKLFGSILASTIWREDDKTRIVWITMLAMADRNGFVAASIPGLADMARVSIDDTKKALEAFMQPDEYSRSKEDSGKRIKEVDGGWLIINHAKYREEPTFTPATEKTGKIYFIRCGKRIKIGFSQNPWARLSTLKTAMPENPVLLGYFSGVFDDERSLHERFSSLRVNREWFNAEKELTDYIATVVNGSATTEPVVSYNTEAEAAPKAKADKKSGYSVPACFESVEGFSAALAGWIEARKLLKKPATGRAIQILIDRLAEQPSRSVEALNAATERGWTTVKWDWLSDSKPRASQIGAPRAASMPAIEDTVNGSR